MTRRPQGHWRLAALLGFLALVILAAPPPSTGRPPSTPEPIITWTAIPSFLSVAPTSKSATIYEPSPTASANATHRPTAPAASVSGPPTWYCLAGVSRCTVGHPDGPGIDLYAAAGPSIRRAIPDWRGRTVTVCAKVCIRVKLIDWCACSGDHFLDLYHDAWDALGRPRRVTVTW